MKDWEEFSAQIDLLPEEVLLQNSADDLLRRLDHIGQMRGEQEEPPPRAARPRRLSTGSETSSAAGGSSICSDMTDGRGSIAAAAASRLYEQRKQPRHRTSGVGKENGSLTSSTTGSVGVPQISDRSKAMIGDREGEVGVRLHQAGQQSAEETQSVYTTQPLSRATHGKQCPPGSPICLLILVRAFWYRPRAQRSRTLTRASGHAQTPHVSMLAKTNGIMSMLREAMLDPKPMVAYADTNIESVLASAAYMLYTDALQAEARASGKKAKPSLWGRDVCVIAYKPKRQRAAVLTSAAKDAAVLAFARGALSGDVRFVSTGSDLFQHLL